MPAQPRQPHLVNRPDGEPHETDPVSAAPPDDSGISTDRLVLRHWSAEDIAAVVSGDRRDGWAHDFPAEGDQIIAGILEEQADGPTRNGHRLVIEQESGEVVGSIGLFWPPTDGAVELGYGIVASRRGRGYASEATRALAESALDTPGVRTVFADVELSNPASVRVLEKAGWSLWRRDEGTARYGRGDATTT